MIYLRYSCGAFTYPPFHSIHWVSRDANPKFHLSGSVTSAPVFAATLAPPTGAHSNPSHALSFSVFRWISSSVMNNLTENNFNGSALFRSGYVLWSCALFWLINEIFTPMLNTKITHVVYRARYFFL